VKTAEKTTVKKKKAAKKERETKTSPFPSQWLLAR
jgi:hypothetical protein